MGLKLYEEADVQALADVTRSLCRTSTNYTMSEMVEALKSLCEPERVNYLTQAVDANGNPYNDGTGFKEGYRLNSSGNETVLAGKYVTGFIPVLQGQTVFLENIHLPANAADNCYFALYNSNKVLIACKYYSTWVNNTVGTPLAPNTKDANNYATSLTITGSAANGFDFSNVAFFRFNCNLIDSTSAIYIENEVSE